MSNQRKSFSQQQESPLVMAWRSRQIALLSLPSRNFGGLLDDVFDLEDVRFKVLFAKAKRDQTI
jgi:hypothetical protein